MNLYDAKNGEYVISSIEDDGIVKDRLLELGIYKGERVRKIKTAPFDGPVMVVVKGVTYALRKITSKRLIVELYESERRKQN